MSRRRDENYYEDVAEDVKCSPQHDHWSNPNEESTHDKPATSQKHKHKHHHRHHKHEHHKHDHHEHKHRKQSSTEDSNHHKGYEHIEQNYKEAVAVEEGVPFKEKQKMAVAHPQKLVAEEEINVEERYKRRLTAVESGVEVPTNEPLHKDTSFSREGDFLQWRNVNMTVIGKKKGRCGKSEGVPIKHILENVFGELPSGEVTAIMGSSGCGKTSLLNVLSGRVSTSSKLNVQADVLMNGSKIDPSDIHVRQLMAFVAQDDSLQVTATPREAIAFSARLRLPKEMTEEKIHQLTEKMISDLNLTECADTIVGGALIKGISGGERKRTSVGVELVTKPALVMLDEATSGLDSFNALALCQVLRKIASGGSSVLMTIHQPNSEIFNKIDRLILLHKGMVMFTGRCSDIPDYFGQRGYPCPPHYNPADWVLTISETVKENHLIEAGFFTNNEGTEVPSVACVVDENTDHAAISKRGPIETIGFFQQTKLLFKRELMNLKRNTHFLKVRTGMTIMVSLLMSLIFYQVAKTDFTQFINVQTTFGALLGSLLANIFSTILPSVLAFPEERPVFLREYSTKHYTVAAYFASRFAMELVVTAAQVVISSLFTYFMIGFSATYGLFLAILYVLAMNSTALGVLLGSSVKDPKVAPEFLPLVFMPQILFAGFFVPPDLIPVWLRWIAYIFPLTYATRLILVAEFDGRCDGLVPNYCEEVMMNVEANPDDTWWYWIVLMCQFVFFRLLALFLLRQKATHFY